MAMSPTCDRLMPDGVSRCKLLYAHGHNQWLIDTAREQRLMSEQFKVAIPYEQRVAGWLYDYSSGQCMGIASDEMKKKYEAGEPFSQNIAGCPHKLVIHPAPIVIDTSRIYEWRYTRSKGDIEVFAPTKAEALRLIRETGMVKRIDESKLKRTSGKLSDHLKKEGIS